MSRHNVFTVLTLALISLVGIALVRLGQMLVRFGCSFSRLIMWIDPAIMADLDIK